MNRHHGAMSVTGREWVYIAGYEYLADSPRPMAAVRA